MIKNNSLYVVLLLLIVGSSSFCGFPSHSNDAHLDSLKVRDSVDVLDIDENTYVEEIKLDSVFEGGIYAEYIEKGLLSFYTCRNVDVWLDSLRLQMGKPDSISEESWRKRYYWHNKNLLNQVGITLFCGVAEEETPNHYAIDIALLDNNLQLIEDSIFLYRFKKQIERLVFTQKEVKQYETAHLAHIPTIGKHPFFSFWNDFAPSNLDSVMLLMGHDKNLPKHWDKVIVRCLVDSTGHIERWKFAKNSDDIEESEAFIRAENFDSYFEKYRKLFRYPVFQSKNEKNVHLAYKTEFEFNNVLDDSLQSDKILQTYIEALNKGKYKKKAKKGKKSIHKTAEAGGTVFFNIEQTGFEPFKPNIQVGKHLYSFWFDEDNEKIYTFQKNNGKWKLQQCINIGDFWGGMFGFEDMNVDGYIDLVISSYPNMNGNSWSDVFIYHAEKDSFLLGAENFCCVGNYDEDYKPNAQYYITNYAGSWYMPVTTSIYSWKDRKMHLEVIMGTELLRRDSRQFDYPIFFVIRNVNGEMKLVKQINTAADDYFEKEAQKVAQSILKEYFRK